MAFAKLREDFIKYHPQTGIATEFVSQFQALLYLLNYCFATLLVPSLAWCKGGGLASNWPRMLGRLLSNRLQRSGPTFTCVTLEWPSGEGKMGMGKGRGEEGLTWRSKERQVPINRTECSVRERARVGGREFGRAIGSTQRNNWSTGAPRALSALLIINFCELIDAISWSWLYQNQLWGMSVVLQ